MTDPSAYENLETVRAEPEARSMIETFRAIGYSVETAIADIVDNAISAGAAHIWIDFEWKGSDTFLSIKDDGHGMDEKELITAMRPGSRSPLENRGKYDLGRFGLGLKTASFSQCRKLTVVSKKAENPIGAFAWDLDFVNTTGNWDLIRQNQPEIHARLDDLASGTVVIWENLDRLVRDSREDDKEALNKFLETAESVKKHLAMVFHRFMEQGKFALFFQQRKVEAWDPYLIGKDGLQSFPEEQLQNGQVTVKGYVLPHKSRISENTFRYAEGPKGWNEQQGFYIYRNQRLLVAGDWLGMFRKEEHFKLARIQVDLPNTLDAEWQIDIKKSVARLPPHLKSQLKAIASRVRAQAVEVYRHRGKNTKPFQGQKFVPLWIDHKRGNKWFYKINRAHPILEKIQKQATKEPGKAIETLLRLIEENIPTKSIFIKETEESEFQGKPYEGMNQDDIKMLMKSIFDSLIEQGQTANEAKAVIINLEPFNHFPEYIANLD